MLSVEETGFWLGASEPSLAEVWDNPQDDEYAKLLDNSAWGIVTETSCSSGRLE